MSRKMKCRAKGDRPNDISPRSVAARPSSNSDKVLLWDCDGKCGFQGSYDEARTPCPVSFLSTAPFTHVAKSTKVDRMVCGAHVPADRKDQDLDWAPLRPPDGNLNIAASHRINTTVL